MVDYPLGVRHDPIEPGAMEELASMVSLVLLPKAQSLWDEWLREGLLVEGAGCWLWTGGQGTKADGKADPTANEQSVHGLCGGEPETDQA